MRLVILVCVVASVGFGQSGGARAGMQPLVDPVAPGARQPIASDDVGRFIRITGSAEVRVAPSGLRIVFAVTADGETGGECTALLRKRMATLREALTGAGVKGESVVEDYIAMLPVYTWVVEEQAKRKVAVEKRTGWILQHNVHVEVSDEPTAQHVIDRATAVGIGEVVAVDHWRNDLATVKQQAQAQALAEAQRKAKVFLGALFAKPLVPINFHEQTQVVYPKDLYQSFTNAYVTRYDGSWNNRLPQISAFRPKNTYYSGLFGKVDVQARSMPMRPEISVVATIDLYYRSPAAALDRREGGKPK